MALKPVDITAPTMHLSWDRANPLTCPMCDSRISHEYNDGGRRVETLKGSLWVVTNYYRCTNPTCDLHKAFPAANDMTLNRKKFGLDVWAKVIQHRFKHKMNYEQIEMVMWDDWSVVISRGTIKAICEYFEAAGKARVDDETITLVKSTGRIVLSLDGAQPQKGRPAFWVFTDRLSGRILHTRYLEIASADILAGIFTLIEQEYNAKIKAVISDKQRSIVNAVKMFNSKLPHVYCQYHFLHHVREPIAAKDSHLLTSLRSAVREFSIVLNRNTMGNADQGNLGKVYAVFTPVAEELLCAVDTRGDRFTVFPGLEAHANLKHLQARLAGYDTSMWPGAHRKSMESLIAGLTTLLSKYDTLASEIAALAMDFNSLRVILKHKSWPAKRVKDHVDGWVYMLQGRLKRRGVEHRADQLKWTRLAHTMEMVEAWQQWVRLVASYEDGLYVAYDDVELEHTNNQKENLFSRVKHHLRSTYGRDDIQDEFEMHADSIVRLLDFDYEPDNVKEVLLATDTALVDAFRDDLHAIYLTTRRKCRIREENTGNFDRFEERLRALLQCK